MVLFAVAQDWKNTANIINAWVERVKEKNPTPYPSNKLSFFLTFEESPYKPLSSPKREPYMVISEKLLITQTTESKKGPTIPDSGYTINKFWDSFLYGGKQKFEGNSYDGTLFYPKKPYPSNPYWSPAHKTKINPVGFEEVK